MAKGQERVPHTPSAGKKEEIRQMFDGIAGSYDVLNHTLSLGIDRTWRRFVRRELKKRLMQKGIRPQGADILDIATGTADLALALGKSGYRRITGIDLSAGMLAIGKRKVAREKKNEQIELLEGDVEQMPFADAQFNAATCAFGVRNFSNLPGGLNETARVLKPGGLFIILEFSQARPALVNGLFNLYFNRLLPFIGRVVSGHRQAYRYLPGSVKEFNSRTDLKAELEKAGFELLRARRLSLGIATAWTARKRIPSTKSVY